MENEFNFSEAANEILGDDSVAESTNEGASEGQSLDENPVTTEENSEASPKDILENLSKEVNPEADKDLIEKLNALGMVHNGQPITVDNIDNFKKTYQMGFDYTKKTMGHAEEVRMKTEEFNKKEAHFKELEAQYAQREQQFSQEMSLNQNMKSILGRIQRDDPELFAYLDNLYKSEEETLSRHAPLMAKYEGELSQLKNEINGIKSQKEQEEIKQIKGGWEKELSETQAKHGNSLAKLGVKVDWKKVEEAWKSDSSMKLSVEDALYASHGKEIAKANESYQKLLATKNKTQSNMLARGGATGGAGKQPETQKVRPGDYESIMKEAAANF